ncbi:NlpC/P60 family protein [Gynuella sunshinyii]|uniref:LRAT domain-containing protein n=1 Tax=Gynuella sunshinyii YC6258 TaxID=1445510 RepID=A0A0C5UYG0_9GAMM|nr:lecithin retinol acyltransferase family protein [Gynuella sunshinyii]AJQ92310.1 hypothetical Protein YC6258_00258 [Gynuella sunshinyii YC6258]
MHPKIRPGYLLYRRKGIIEHVGVYLGGGQVVHNSPNNDVEIVNIQTYAEGHTIRVVSMEFDDIEQLRHRLHQILNANRKYRATHRNCEHIASYLLWGRSSSPQIQAFIAGALIAGFAAWKAGNKNWLGYAVAGGMIGCMIYNHVRNYDYRMSMQTPY